MLRLPLLDTYESVNYPKTAIVQGRLIFSLAFDRRYTRPISIFRLLSSDAIRELGFDQGREYNQKGT